MDPIAEMFSQIKNAQNARRKQVTIFYSKIKMAILGILKEHHQIADFRLVEKKSATKKKKSHFKEIKKIEIDLLDKNQIDIKRVSRPGRRVYTSSVNIPWPKKADDLVIISTAEGILEGEKARKIGLGGEVIAEVK